MIKFLPEIIISICVISYGIITIVGIQRGTVKPVLASRIFFLLALFLSALTDFRQTGVHGLLSNTFNLVDTLSSFAIVLFTLFHKDTRKKFTKFEKICLGAVIFIFLGWIISKENILAHLSVQVILVIAYLPTLIHLWKSSQNTESLGAWSLDLFASLLSIIEPLRTMDLLPLVYGIRSIISTFAVIILILRIKFRKIKAV
ncbi:MAG TPA: hypothetical protein VGO21_03210 [Candidatus Paceibacterota bacterium]|jgi:hypothetical protein|nr:hypothetical protein [Candidatus Paceibacterota bacterium]